MPTRLVFYTPEQAAEVKHEHAARHTPASGTGYQTCGCGATRRINNGVVGPQWHTCPLCTHPWGLVTGEDR